MKKRAILRKIGLVGLLLALLAAIEPGSPVTVGAGARSTTAITRTIVVDPIADDNYTGGCTLREAIDVANSGLSVGALGCTLTESGSGDPVNYVLSLPGYTYALTGAAWDDANWSGDLDVWANVTFQGAGVEETVIDGSDNDRVFHIDPAGVGGFTVNFYGLTIRDGWVDSDGGGIHIGHNNTVNVEECVIFSNTASSATGAAGGGIYSDGGAVKVINSTISDNRATSGPHNAAHGGGIHAAYGTLDVVGSTIQNNSGYVSAGANSRVLGGGISSLGCTVSISDTTISDNKTLGPISLEFIGLGGGICAYAGTLRVGDGSILSGNEAKDSGGAIYSSLSTTTVSGSTVSGNSATDGAGIYTFGFPGTAGGGIAAPLASVDITAGTIIDHNQADDRGGGIFNSVASELTIDSSTVSDNTAEDGGGIFNVGLLTIQNGSLIGGDDAGNEANEEGGGIYNERGSLTVNSSTVSGNNSQYDGGGLYNQAGVLLLNDSTVSGNTSGLQGGGIYSDGEDRATFMLNKCTISDNTANGSGAGGGGIYLYYSHASLANTTVSGNRATRSNGGGIGSLSDDVRSIALVHCTIANNSAIANGGGAQLESAFTTNISSTILAGNSAGGAGPDIYGAINSQDYNLIQDTSGATIGGTTTHDITGLDPQLGPLADNGGATQTRALLAGSPAIDAIPEASCPLPNDQRGVSRPQRSGCDIGAYEADSVQVFLPLILRDYD